ncbi:MAG: hypothetical protein JWO59_1007 [Chloroflexi bacterium]|nr:hypothetical protein [Chloroflexota bacterium]
MSDLPGAPVATEAQDMEWPDHLDAVVAAPDHHTLLFENDKVRVLDTCVRSGHQTPIHTHRWPAALYVLEWSHFVRRDANSVVLLDSRTVPALQQPPPVLWSAPLPPHAIRVVGDGEVHIISVEIKG